LKALVPVARSRYIGLFKHFGLPLIGVSDVVHENGYFKLHRLENNSSVRCWVLFDLCIFVA
jgi:hypothetical protein